jgi:hypothetical protein
MELMFNGAGVLKVEDGKYYIVDEVYEVYKQVDKKEFIEELKQMSWVCLTSWDAGLRKQYLDLVDYVKESE